MDSDMTKNSTAELNATLLELTEKMFEGGGVDINKIMRYGPVVQWIQNELTSRQNELTSRFVRTATWWGIGIAGLALLVAFASLGVAWFGSTGGSTGG